MVGGFSDWLRQFSILQRLMTVFLASSLTWLMLGGIGVMGQRHALGVTTQLVSMDAVALNEVTMLRLAVSELRQYERNMVIFCESNAESKKAYVAWNEAFERAQALLRKIQALPLGEQERKLLAETTQGLAGVEALFRPIAKKLVDEVAFQSPFFAASAMEAMVPAFKLLDASSSGLAAQLQANFDAGMARVETASRLVVWLLVSATALALLLIGPLIWVNTQIICKPLNLAKGLAQRIAQGDLSQTLDSVKGRDEVAQLSAALQHMQGELQQLVGEVRAAANAILLASSEVASGNLDLSQRTERTAASLQEATSSFSSFTQAIAASSGAARQASEWAQSAATVAVAGGDVVGQVEQTMNNINASSAKISEITSLIDSIAFQTNILALNAAVEAARAGDQGRGFSVVAAEVRVLATRSASAASEIKALIQESVARVVGGGHLVRKAGQTISSVVDSTRRVTGVVEEISRAALTQADQIAQANQTVMQIDAMTQQNAALVEQSAAAAENLKGQADRLGQLVGRFKLGTSHGEQTHRRLKATLPKEDLVVA